MNGTTQLTHRRTAPRRLPSAPCAPDITSPMGSGYGCVLSTCAFQCAALLLPENACGALYCDFTAGVQGLWHCAFYRWPPGPQQRLNPPTCCSPPNPLRCPNAPEMRRLNWTTALANLDNVNTINNRWTRYNVNSQSAVATGTYIRVQ